MKNMIEIPGMGRAWVSQGKWYADDDNMLSYIECEMYDHHIGFHECQDSQMILTAAKITGAKIVALDETPLPPLPPGAVT